MTGHVAEPPVPEAGHLFQQIGFDIDHPVAPAALGGGFAGVDLVRVHGNDGFLRREMLAAAIAKAFGTGFNRADAEGFMGVRLKGVVRNMRVIQLQARQLRQMAKARAVSFIIKLFRYALHGEPPRGSSFHYQR
jgi:hypothetical protein